MTAKAKAGHLLPRIQYVWTKDKKVLDIRVCTEEQICHPFSLFIHSIPTKQIATQP